MRWSPRRRMRTRWLRRRRSRSRRSTSSRTRMCCAERARSSRSVAAAGAAAFLPLQEWHGAFIGSALYWSGTMSLPLMTAQLAATTPRDSLGRAIGLVFGAYFLGNIIGSPFAGALGAAVGLRATIGLAVLAFIASTTLVFGVRAMPPIAERGSLRFPRTFWTLLGVAPVGALLSIVSIALQPLYLREIR